MAGLSRRTFLGATGAAGLGTVLGAQFASAAPLGCSRAAGTTAYVGSYTSTPPAGHGLDVVGRSGTAPALTPVRTVAGVPDASWFDRSRDGRTLYVTNEGDPNGAISALDVTTAASPKLLNSVSSKGSAPTHLSVHSSQKYVLAANYGSGSVVVLPILAGGKLGPATDVQQHTGAERDAHAHQVVNDPTGQWVLSVDLGADSVYVYSLDTGRGKLALHQQVTLPSGAGPRHLVFHPNGRYAYLAQELRPEITVLSWDAAAGKLTPLAVVPAVPPGSTGDLFPGEIAVSQDAKFVHATVRGPNTIATFSVSGGGTTLKLVSSVDTGGNWPRHLALSPDERWFYVANQRSGTVTWLPRDPTTGRPGVVAGSLAVPSVNSVFFA
ncbi:beta-propeller fold lactonase family protein [Amycolatopsis rhabdoformis]|uniref:Beta-propeller fold lactonase family protein n=1 Tax=Amycolatopsis rhabdoformis TaxID=1448059 RepID=A0ABZ1II63_9PSEU|nr:beta-propeller fold lactonase family protein [Amycolatopsis rhabdoformis]WSE33937.1 beta-propeller fold lactonase family protein [Amycolatopsis rhabdoformis]